MQAEERRSTPQVRTPTGPCRAPRPPATPPPPRPHAQPRPLLPPRQGTHRPAGAAPCPSQSAALTGRSLRPRPSYLGTNWSVQPSLTRSRPAPAFPVFVHPPLQKKTSAEPWRLPTAGGKRRGKERGAREGGTAGRQRLKRRRRGARPSRSHLYREQNGGAGEEPTVRRGRGHSPSAPTLAPAWPVTGSPLSAPGRGRGGEGSGPAHYAKRLAPPPPPRGKGKRVGFSRRRGASMSARQARPLRRRPEPAPALFQFYLRIWRQSSLEAGPVSAAGGPRRGGQGAGRPGSRRWGMAGAPGPRARGAAGERRDAEVGAGAGPEAPPGSQRRGVCYCFYQ